MRQYDISCSIMWRQHYAQPITMIYSKLHNTNTLQLEVFLQTCGSKNWATANQSLRLGWPNSSYRSTYYASWIVWWQTFSHLLRNGTLRLKRLNKCSHRSFYVIPFKVEYQGLFEVRDVQVHDQGSSHKLQDVQDRTRRVQVLAHGCLHILACTRSCTTDLPKSRSNIHLENDEGGVRWVVLIALFAAFLVVLSALLSLFGVVFLLGVLVVCWGLLESVAIYWGVASLKMVAVAVASRAKANKC